MLTTLLHTISLQVISTFICYQLYLSFPLKRKINAIRSFSALLEPSAQVWAYLLHYQIIPQILSVHSHAISFLFCHQCVFDWTIMLIILMFTSLSFPTCTCICLTLPSLLVPCHHVIGSLYCPIFMTIQFWPAFLLSCC